METGVSESVNKIFIDFFCPKGTSLGIFLQWVHGSTASNAGSLEQQLDRRRGPLSEDVRNEFVGDMSLPGLPVDFLCLGQFDLGGRGVR